MDTNQNMEEAQPYVPNYINIAPQGAGPSKWSKAKWHVIYGSIILVLLLAAVGGAIWLHYKYVEAVTIQQEAYLQAQANFESAHKNILEEQVEWEAQLREKNDELNSIYTAQQEAIDEEQARWDSLSEDEQRAELICIEYNKMVDFLRTNDPEYEEIYVEYSKYLTQDIFNLGKDEALQYTILYQRKLEIEQKYWDEHGSVLEGIGE